MTLNLRFKLIIQNIMIFLIVFLIIYFVMMNVLYESILNKSVEFVDKRVDEYKYYIDETIKGFDGLNIYDYLKEKSPIISEYMHSKLDIQIEIYNNRKEMMSQTLPNKKYYVYQDVHYAVNGKKTYIIKNDDGIKLLFFSAPIFYDNEVIGCIRYIYPLISEFEIIAKNNLIFIITGILSFIAVFFMSYIYSFKILNPLKKLKNEAEKISEGDFNSTININTGDEIEELTNSFNKMSENINKYIKNLKDEKDKQKRFVDNIAHELKTPLTSIIGYSEILPKLKDSKDIEKSLEYINNQGKRLLILVEEMLYISKLNKNSIHVVLKNHSIKKILEDALNTLRPRIEKFSINIIKQFKDTIVRCDYEKTYECFLNIIDNSIKHSNCSTLEFKIVDDKEYKIIEIKDNGKGIDEKNIDKIFEPFYSGSKEIKSTGLGLSIVKDIMKKQNGDIKIESVENEYTKVILKFESSESI